MGSSMKYGGGLGRGGEGKGLDKGRREEGEGSEGYRVGGWSWVVKGKEEGKGGKGDRRRGGGGGGKRGGGDFVAVWGNNSISR